MLPEDFANKLNVKIGDTPKLFRTGKISGFDIGTRTAYVTIGGEPSSVPARYLGSYNPIVGDVVQVLVQNTDRLIIGTTKRDTGGGGTEIDPEDWIRDFLENPITADELGPGAVITEKIAANAITVDKIVDRAIERVKIAEAAINAELIAMGAVTETKIANDSITTVKIRANQIIGEHIQSRSVNAFHIVAGSITAFEIATRTITADKIQTNSITAGEIAAGTITADKIASNTITAGSAIIANGAIGSAQIANAAITNAKILDLSVTNAKIVDGSITSAKIFSLDANKISAGTITASVTIISGDFRTPGNRAIRISGNAGGRVEFGFTGVPDGWMSAVADSALAISADTVQLRSQSNRGIEWNENISIGPVFRPLADNLVLLGNASRRWRLVYATNGTVQTSDARAKKDILTATVYNSRLPGLARGIVPKSYHMKEETDDAPQHLGFDVEEIQELTKELGVNLAAIYDPKEDPELVEAWENYVPKYDANGNEINPVPNPADLMMGINYAELMPLLWMWVQELEQKIETLEEGPGNPNA